MIEREGYNYMSYGEDGKERLGLKRKRGEVAG